MVYVGTGVWRHTQFKQFQNSSGFDAERRNHARFRGVAKVPQV